MSGDNDSTESHSVRVFLRVRPFTARELRALEPQEAKEPGSREDKQALFDSRISSILRLDKCSISICPGQAHLLGPEIRASGAASFEFDQIFASVSQGELFERTVEPLVDQLFGGRSSLVFAHGTTNSGKTYTIYGRRHDRGLVWRSLARILQQAYGDQAASDQVPPSAEEAARLRDLRRWVSEVHAQNSPRIPPLNCQTQSLNAEQQALNAAPFALKMNERGRNAFQVRISALEIYNDQIYDLITAPILHTMRSSDGKPERDSSNRNQRLRREPVHLREDSKGNMVLDLEQVRVTSMEDVEMLMTLAANNRRTDCSVRNQHSSRSHSAFMVHLTKLAEDSTASAGVSPATEWQSVLAFVDLAGAERAPPNASPLQVREAAQINTSLMHLRRCLEILRLNRTRMERQAGTRPQLVPFRQSRLTRLFQRLMETGSVTMIACISPYRPEANETIHALRCASFAKSLQQEPKRRPLWELQTPKDPPAVGFSRMRLASKEGTPRGPQIQIRDNHRSQKSFPTISRYQPKTEYVHQSSKRDNSETRDLVENKIRQECAEEMETAIASIRGDYERRIATLEAELRQQSQEQVTLVTSTAMREREHYRHALSDARAEIELLEKQLREAREREEQLVATLQCLRKESTSLRRMCGRCHRNSDPKQPEVCTASSWRDGSTSSRETETENHAPIAGRLRRRRSARTDSDRAT
ncbi:hypothetical protein CCYA_CCYA18G4548 [Cyanidiococcus yangmingshanensis]|nr:hypothetical protein CCYA_CCYA18G4548 [Cyanidiococcus yangmingshanensis]